MSSHGLFTGSRKVSFRVTLATRTYIIVQYVPRYLLASYSLLWSYGESCVVWQKCAANYTFYFVSGSRTLWIWDIHSRAVSAIHCSKLFNRQCTSQFFYLKYQKYHHQVAYYWASSFCCSLSVPTRFTVDVHYWSYQGHSRSSILVYQSTAHMRLPICQ